MVGLADKAFSISESAAFIWRQVDGQRTVAEIADLLAAEYDIDADAALSDTLEFLGDLSDQGLFRVAESAPEAS